MPIMHDSGNDRYTIRPMTTMVMVVIGAGNRNDQTLKFATQCMGSCSGHKFELML